MGSEMCIRDSYNSVLFSVQTLPDLPTRLAGRRMLGLHRCMHYKWHHFSSCVYTTEFSNGDLLFDFAEQICIICRYLDVQMDSIQEKFS